MSELIDDVLAGLAAARETMQRQTVKIAEIMEKSNNTLLHIEAQNLTPGISTTITSPPYDVTSPKQPQNLYNLKPESEMAIVKILEQFQLLMQHTAKGDANVAGYTALDVCMAYRQRSEFLGSSIRKVVALFDIMAQIRQNMLKQQELDEENKENTDDEF